MEAVLPFMEAHEPFSEARLTFWAAGRPSGARDGLDASAGGCMLLCYAPTHMLRGVRTPLRFLVPYAGGQPTRIAYDAISLRVYRMTLSAYAYSVWCYQSARGLCKDCIVVPARQAMAAALALSIMLSTDNTILVLSAYAPGTQRPLLCPTVVTRYRNSAIGLRACYAKPGTEVAYGAIGLRACYAKPGTEVAYTPTAHEKVWY
eukprot:1133231-Rhodomonas_salina.1